MISITRKIVFHAGHMLKDDLSKCYNPHGHEYVLECTINGDVQDTGSEAGMIMHFGILKEIMMAEVHDVFDHKFIIDASDPRAEAFSNAVGIDALVVMICPPTAENLVSDFAQRITNKLLSPTWIKKLRLYETCNCWADYEG